jgi:hypothetical protein
VFLGKFSAENAESAEIFLDFSAASAVQIGGRASRGNNTQEGDYLILGQSSISDERPNAQKSGARPVPMLKSYYEPYDKLKLIRAWGVPCIFIVRHGLANPHG